MIVYGNVTIVAPPVSSLVYAKPEGFLSVITPPDSILSVLSSPQGVLQPLPSFQSIVLNPFYAANVSQLATPLAVILEILYIPVMALDDGTGFIVLDDGGRLQIN